MSIASEITRLQGAKSDLKTSIENKGVTVPSATTIDGYASLVDQISTGATLQSKSVTPTESAQTVSPDAGYDGLSSVSVGAISSTYIGSGVTQKSAQTYTPTTSTQTIASGQYLVGAQTINPIPSEYIIPSGSVSITSNGTVDVTSFASAIVNVSGGGGGGASNYVTGTFKGITADTMLPITISYNGSGYPIAVQIYPTGGSYNSDGGFYSLVSRYKTCIYTAVKCISDTPPDYSGSDDYRNFASVVNFYKNSTSDSTNYSVTSNRAFRFYYDTSYPTGSSPYYQSVRFASATTMRVTIGVTGTGGGFAPNIEYTYNIVYSS